jgi:hypothetical protein
VLLVHGTWSGDFKGNTATQWWEPGSSFAAFLANQGLDAEVFELCRWSGDLTGLARLLPWNWFRSPESRDWEAGAQALRYLLEPRGCPAPFWQRNVIAHSHGGQVALLAAASGLSIRRLVTVSTPVRGDMVDAIIKARPNIERWLHVYDPTLKDRMQVLGEIGDGRLGWKRSFPVADVNVSVAGAGHSGVLTQPEWFRVWKTRGLIDFFDDSQNLAA